MALPVVTASQFDREHDLPDWRYVLGRIEARFRAGSFGEGARFTGLVADAADAADHHPDIDLRYPGVVHVTLKTHVSDALTGLDTDLAKTISALAAREGLRSEPLGALGVEIAIDAMEIDRVLPFWRAVLGYVDERPRPDGRVLALVDPSRIGPAVWFQQMDEPRPQRSRIHIDVTVAHDVADERVAAAIAAGGRLLTDAYARSFWVLADPEGNEACVCTWQDRD
jgi:4a-hydroxytetrahydrobiopterin dehydratase